MGYLLYYFLYPAARYLLNYPVLLMIVAAFFLLRRWLPDPVLFVKHAGKVRVLKGQISQNADNVTARRDLAKIWLEKRRPRRAIPLLVEARRRPAQSSDQAAELAFLYGKALLLSGRPEESLPPLVEATQLNEKVQYGDAYLVAGRALYALGRNAEAEDAFGRFVRINSSSVEGQVRLACARRELRDRTGAKQSMHDALDTFAHLPGFRRRKELFWYLRARLMTVGLA